MIVWLDHLIFGRGRGLSQPYFDGVYYWLVDTSNERRRGQFYTWSGWFGSQLQSFQWRHPKPQETRRLAEREFRPFCSERRWLRVRVSWAQVGLSKDIDKANAALRRLRAELGSGLYDAR